MGGVDEGGIDEIFEPEDMLMSKGYKRQKAIQDAVTAADRIILDRSDGSVEETNYLTMKVALAFINKVDLAHISAMLRKDLGL